MKKTLALLAAGMIPAMMFAADFTLKPTSLWKKTADDAAAIDYDGRKKVWPRLNLKTEKPLKPNTLYRISFEAKSTSPVRIYCGFDAVIKDRKIRPYTRFIPTAEFKKYTCYFTSGDAPKGMPGIYFDPTSAFRMEVRNIKLTKMTDELLYGENLLPGGDFEEGHTFFPNKPELLDSMKIVDSANFISGEKSLLLDCVQGKGVAFSSGFLPAVPGKEIEVKFSAKSDAPARIIFRLNWWEAKSKHYYHTATFKTENDWREFSLKFKVSDDVETYPVLLRRLVNFIVVGQPVDKGGDAKIHMDGISFTILK